MQSLMVIDDDEVDQYIAERALKKWGFKGPVFQERDGASALDFLTNYQENKEKHGNGFPPTLILLDINMPRMDGFEFLEAFEELTKKNDYFNSSVIMMFSSSERKEDKERALKYAFVLDYITKPLTQENIAKIMEALSKRDLAEGGVA